MHQRSLIAELARELGKSEEEVRQFLLALWQQLPMVAEIQPPFVRYLEARIEGLKERLETEIASLRREMQTEIANLRREVELGFQRAEERDEALQQAMEAGFKRMEERDEALRQEVHQLIDGLRREMDERFVGVGKEIEALCNEVHRLERWFLAFAIPVLLMLAGILLQNFLK
ncbi:MAG: hypothetical protein C4295_10415 [Candidatus Fervidibacterota bacterium]